MKPLLVNLSLLLLALLLVLLAGYAADWVIGPPSPPSFEGKPVSLLFAPNGKEDFESSEFRFTAEINALGLRDVPIVPGKQKRLRIVAIGDSFTYGWGVDIQDTWVKRIESFLRGQGHDVEVINAGRSGAGSASYEEMAARILPVLQPDILLMGMLHNDVGLSHAERVDLGKPLWLDTLGFLFPNALARIDQSRMEKALLTPSTQGPPERSIERNREMWQEAANFQASRMTAEQRARLDALAPEIRDQYFGGMLNPFMVSVGVTAPFFYSSVARLDEPAIEEIVNRVATNLEAVKQLAKKHGAETLVAIVPAGPYTNRPQNKSLVRLGFETDESMLSSEIPDRLTREASARAGLDCFSVTDAFRQRMDDPSLYFPLDNHFTSAGHALFAESLAPLIEGYLKDKPSGKNENP